MLNAEYLRRRLHYDPLAGCFTWNYCEAMRPQWNARFAGKPAGGIRPDGYVRIVVDNQLYLASRLALVWMTGEWPPVLVDHADLDTSNTRWANLRLATKSQNAANSGLLSNNSSGHKGVWRAPSGRWVAEYWQDGKKHRVGVFDQKADAAAARNAAFARAFGEFARAA
jgi:hypothetical protein